MIMARHKNRQIHPLPKSHECTNLLSFLGRYAGHSSHFSGLRQHVKMNNDRSNGWSAICTRPLNFHFRRSLSRSPSSTTASKKKNGSKLPPSQCCFTKIYVAFVHWNGRQHPTAATDDCVWSLGAARSSFPRFQRQVGFIGAHTPDTSTGSKPI